MHDPSDFYQSVILDHSRRPRNFSVLPEANRVGRGCNPLCGDQVTVYLRMDGDQIADISFQGAGCAISQASASLMTQNLKGKTVSEAEEVFASVRELITTGIVPEEGITELAALSGIHRFPIRVKCATLGWHAALNAAKGISGIANTE